MWFLWEVTAFGKMPRSKERPNYQFASTYLRVSS